MNVQTVSPATPVVSKSAERRANGSVRLQVQAWFDALRAHLSQNPSNNAIVSSLAAWEKPEDVMRASPSVIPLLLTMAWQLRATPGFAEHFQTASGSLAENTTDILALSGKSFDAILLANLKGAMRLCCERQQTEWLVVHRAKKRSPLAKFGMFAPVLKMLGLRASVPDSELLNTYPQRGLYDAIKHHLHTQAQFALIKALAHLPTRTVLVLGEIVQGLISAPAILNLANLEAATIKFVVELAEIFARASVPGPDDAPVDPRRAGAVISDVLRDGLHGVRLAAQSRDQARDVVRKMAPSMADSVWQALASKEIMLNTAHCPTPISNALGNLTLQVHEAVSAALERLDDDAVAFHMADIMLAGAGRQRVAQWIGNAAYVEVWDKLVREVNRKVIISSHVELGLEHKNLLRKVCLEFAPRFDALGASLAGAAEPAKVAPTTLLHGSAGLQLVS